MAILSPNGSLRRPRISPCGIRLSRKLFRGRLILVDPTSNSSGSSLPSTPCPVGASDRARGPLSFNPPARVVQNRDQGATNADRTRAIVQSLADLSPGEIASSPPDGVVHAPLASESDNPLLQAHTRPNTGLFAGQGAIVSGSLDLFGNKHSAQLTIF